MSEVISVDLSHLQINEILHKLSIVRDEPDLLDSYELTPDEAESLYDCFAQRSGGGTQLVTFEARFLDVVIGELANRTEALGENWIDRGDQAEGGVYRSLKAALKKLQAFEQDGDSSPSP